VAFEDGVGAGAPNGSIAVATGFGAAMTSGAFVVKTVNAGSAGVSGVFTFQ
jgi:hypothetical protein